MSGCFFQAGPIAIGDCGSKSTINVSRSSVTQNSTKSVMSSFSDNTTSKVAIQEQNVNVIGNCCKPLVIDQFFNVSAASFNKDTTTLATQSISTMIADIQTQISQQQSSKTDLLSSVAGAGTLIQNVKDALTQINQSDSVKQAVKKNLDKTVNIQRQTVNITCTTDASGMSAVPADANIGPDGRAMSANGCYINQKFIANLVSNNTFDTIMNELNNNQQLLKAKQEFSSAQKAENSGLGDLVGQYGKILIAIALCIVAAIFILPKILEAGKGYNISSGPGGFSVTSEAPASTAAKKLQSIMMRLRM